MISFTVMTGAVTSAGQLTRFTKFKLWMFLQLADWFHHNGVSYRYVFPQGAQAGCTDRPCDLMGHYVLKHDPRGVKVPIHVPDGINLLKRADRVAFVEQVAATHKSKVFGLGMVFRPSHYRGLEDDPMKDVLAGEMPGEILGYFPNDAPERRLD